MRRSRLSTRANDSNTSEAGTQANAARPRPPCYTYHHFMPNRPNGRTGCVQGVCGKRSERRSRLTITSKETRINRKYLSGTDFVRVYLWVTQVE